MKVVERTIPDIIDTEYKEYSLYVLEQRAIPNVIDGLKPVQRKILYQMVNTVKDKRTKISEIGGSLSGINYHHGEASAIASTVKMGQAWDNNLTLIDDCKTNFGSRLVHEASAARYIFGKLSSNYKDYFKDTTLAPARPDADDPEPRFYLPIIPWILVNGIRGIAVGFACEFQPYNPRDLARVCRDYVMGKNIDKVELKPWYKNYTGTIERNDEGVWCARGKYAVPGQTEIVITETTPSEDCEGYINFLNKMIDQDRIQDYEDQCDKRGFRFTLKVTRKQRDWFEENPYKRLRLEQNLNENLTSIGIDGKLIVFNSVIEVIKYFCVVRQQFYVKRRTQELLQIEQDLRRLALKKAFIRAILDDKIRFKGVLRAQLEAQLEKNLKATNEEAKWLTTMNIYSLTEDMLQELDAKILEQQKKNTSVEGVTPQDMFKGELDTIAR